jgi:hypothetical protein
LFVGYQSHTYNLLGLASIVSNTKSGLVIPLMNHAVETAVESHTKSAAAD